jgi:hypothetical protein
MSHHETPLPVKTKVNKAIDASITHSRSQFEIPSTASCHYQIPYVFLRRMTADAASIVSCNSRDSSSSHQSQKQDNVKAMQDDDKYMQEGFGNLTPNPAETTTYAVFHPTALHTLLPLADATCHPTST